MGTSKSKRILGIDVARACAVVGMAFVHFALVLAHQAGETSALFAVLNRVAGRPATVFMILAGIGVSLRLRNSDQERLLEVKSTLIRRGWFFLAVGFLNLLWWDGDILRVYGVSYLVVAYLLKWSSRKLVYLALEVVGLFVVFVLIFDFETNWDFETLHYSNLWTVSGAFLNLFFNGFRAVFPWLGLMFLGMVVGRMDLAAAQVRKRLVMFGLGAWLAAEVCSTLLLSQLRTNLPAGMDLETVQAVFGTDSLPALPLFLVSSGGIAIAFIAATIHVVDRPEFCRYFTPLVAAGQMAFTWYVLHIGICYLLAILSKMRGDYSLVGVAITAFAFFLGMAATSYFWRERFRVGPLEGLLRKVAG